MREHTVLRELVSGPLYLKVAEAIERHSGYLEQATAARKSRQRWVAAIRDNAEIVDGKPMVALIKWERDCDCVEFTSRRLVEATPAAVDEAAHHDYEWAEGPVRHWIQRPSDPFQPESRDRALEAFEDGHPHVIYA